MGFHNDFTAALHSTATTATTTAATTAAASTTSAAATRCNMSVSVMRVRERSATRAFFVAHMTHRPPLPPRPPPPRPPPNPPPPLWCESVNNECVQGNDRIHSCSILFLRTDHREIHGLFLYPFLLGCHVLDRSLQCRVIRWNGIERRCSSAVECFDAVSSK